MLVSTTIYHIFLHKALSLAKLLCNINQKIKVIYCQHKTEVKKQKQEGKTRLALKLEI